MKANKTHTMKQSQTLIKTLLQLSLALTPMLTLMPAPAQAAIQRSADFSEGSSIGLGLYGISYDYGFSFFSVGLETHSSSTNYLGNPIGSPLKPGLRVMGRLYQKDGLSAGLLAGLHFDPGDPGGRAYLTPDLGLGVAYDFRQFSVPFALRLNLTVALSDPRNRYYSIDDPQPAPNFFQRLSFGPQTSLELAWLPTDNLEVTLGGGTFLGMRLKF